MLGTSRALLISSLLATGCIPYTTTTTITLRDPRAVAMRAGCCDELVLPASGAPAEALLAEGRVATTAGTAADVAVAAQRAGDGSIVLAWRTNMALPHGDLQIALPTTPTWTVQGPAADAVTSGEVARIRFCAELRSLSSRGTHLGYTPTSSMLPASSADTCEWTAQRAAFPYVLETSRDNVVEIRTTKTPTLRMLAWLELPMAGAMIGGGIYAAARPGASRSAQILGGGLAALGFAIAIPLAPSAFARTHETVVSR